MGRLPTKGLLFEEETYRIRGAAFQVYRTMGPGFLEAVYQECLAIEMSRRGIPFATQKSIQLRYGGQLLRQGYIADFFCFESVIVELKAVSSLLAEHRAQIFNYLHATGVRVGLLINFGSSSRIQVERVAL